MFNNLFKRSDNSRGSLLDIAKESYKVSGAAALAVDFQLLGHSGVPCGSCLAYDSAQRIMAIGTDDGRVKILGRRGVEALLCSSARDATHEVVFCRGRDWLVRLSKKGIAEVWDLTTSLLLGTFSNIKDPLTAVEPLPGLPFVAAGCQSGCLRMLSITAGCTTGDGVRPTSYSKAASELAAAAEDAGLKVKGAVVLLLVQTDRDAAVNSRLLIGYADNSLLLWDLYLGHLLATGRVPPDATLVEPVELTAACWASGQCDRLATGHSDGTIRLWGLPSPSVTAPHPTAPPVKMKLLARLDASVDDSDGPVGSLAFSGKAGAASETLYLTQECLGADPVRLLALAGGEAASVTRGELPWMGPVCGMVVVPRRGRGPDAGAAACMVLSEGGQLHVHRHPADPREAHRSSPAVVERGLQRAPPVTALSAWGTPPHEPSSPSGVGALSGLAPAAEAAEVREAAAAEVEGLALTGGNLPGKADGCSLPRIFVTGHADGTARLWDADVLPEPSMLTCTTPAVEQDVTLVHLIPELGLLVVGHADGAVGLHVWHQTPGAHVRCKQVPLEAGQDERRSSDSSSAGAGLHAPAPAVVPGFQLALVVRSHAAAVRAAAVVCAEQRGRALALGDDEGVVSMLSLDTGMPLYCTQVGPAAVVSLAVVPGILNAGQQGVEDATQLSLMAALANATVVMLDADMGAPLGGPMTPKAFSRPLSTAALDGAGVPIHLPITPGLLTWIEYAVVENDLQGERDESDGPPADHATTPVGELGGAAPTEMPCTVELEEEHSAHRPSDRRPADVSAPCARIHTSEIENETIKQTDEQHDEAAGPEDSSGSNASKPPGSPSAPLDSPLDSPWIAPGPSAPAGSPLARTSTQSSSTSSAAQKAEAEMAQPDAKLEVEGLSGAPAPPAGGSQGDAVVTAAAAYVLVCSEEALRLYLPDSLKKGDRTTLKKVQ
ncbi:hypothetical protein CYMTET_13746, partial [Cymbomonas tetramitiformis]